MARRPLFILFLIAAALGVAGGLRAQMESGERGILPIDSSGTLEITGIEVDVSGEDAQAARFAGWREAQRKGFAALWAKAHGKPASQAPNLSDSTLDSMVSSITIEREQMGPTRYIASLGVLFDRTRSAELLGMGSERRVSVPMLLVPVLITGGADVSVEYRNAWQRAWAELRTSQTPIDYVRISGLGIDPLLVNAAQTRRPGRGWWRNVIDLYGAADILVAEVRLHRLYPGGPATARFTAFHGPDREPVGSFGLVARDGKAVPAMMREGVRQMDAMFAAALESGRLARDSSLDIPEPPLVPVEEEERDAPVESGPKPWTYQVQIVADGAHVYNFAMAHLRTTAGVDQVAPIAINPQGTSYVNVTFRGDLANLRTALAARGWTVEQDGYVLRIRGGSVPPPLPAPTAPASPTAPQQPPAPAPSGAQPAPTRPSTPAATPSQ